MTKTIVLGIDGLDADWISRNLHSLPSFQHLFGPSGIHRMRSVFPPDSDPAWATFYTGRTPAEHGILDITDPVAKSARLMRFNTSTDTIRGRALWDEASEAGLHCAVVFAHLTFPPWPINGLMIARSSTKDEFRVSGELPRRGLLEPEHHTLKKFPTQAGRELYVEEAFTRIEAEQELFRELLAAEQWDFFFCYSSTLDLVEHFFWANSESSAGLDGGDIVRRAYTAYDRMLGRLAGQMTGADRLFVVSDHGHGPRPTMEFRVVSYLVDSLALRIGKTHESRTVSRRRSHPKLSAGKFMSWLLSRLDVMEPARHILRFMPRAGILAGRLDTIGPRPPFVLALSSPIKAYSYGGLNFGQSSLSSGHHEIDVGAVLETLKTAVDYQGHPLFEWVIPREQLDEGPYLHRLPKIVFQLREAFAATQNEGPPYLAPNTTANLVPGSHRRGGATFASTLQPSLDTAPTDLRSAHDTMLHAIFDRITSLRGT